MDLNMNESDDVFDVPQSAGEETGKEAEGGAPDDLRILEAVLFASDELITAEYLKTILPSRPDARKIRGMVEKINIQLQRERHPFEIVEIGGGYQFRTITYYHPWVRQIFKEKAAKRLSIQALESLAVIAYKQPISKAEIEAIRGVVSDGAIKTLLEKRLITVAGRSEKPGRPLLYGTTHDFLKYFGLNKIDDLPRIEEFEAMAREKIEELTIDELARPETAPGDEADVSIGEGPMEEAGEPAKTPEKSSLFEVDITAASPVNGQQKAETPAQDRLGDEAADFEFTVRADASDEPAKAATFSDSEEGEFKTKKEDSASEKKPKDGTGARETDIVVAADGATVKSETAFDIEMIAQPDKPAEEKPQREVRKIKREFVEGAALRGETAFDLEAIVIEEPVLPVQAGSGTKNKSSESETVNENEDAFEVMVKAPGESEAAVEESEQHDAAEVPAFNLGDEIKEVAPLTPAGADDEEETFEITAPAEVKGEAFSFEKAVDALAATDEEETMFEIHPEAVSSPPDQYQKECDKLSEALKETAVILPEKIKKSSTRPAGRTEKSTGATGKKRGAGAGSATKKPDAGNSSEMKPRRRRGSDPGAAGAA